jgi:hypothetical protein
MHLQGFSIGCWQLELRMALRFFALRTWKAMMNYLYLALSWIFGLLFLLLGLLELSDSLIVSSCMVGLSCLLLPPIKIFALKKFNVETPFKYKSLFIFILLITSTYFIVKNQESKKQTLVVNEDLGGNKKLEQVKNETQISEYTKNIKPEAPSTQINGKETQSKTVSVPSSESSQSTTRTITSKEAKAIAANALSITLEVENVLSDVLETRDKDGYYRYIFNPILEVIHNWPSPIDTQAIVPFQVCFIAIDNLRNYSDMMVERVIDLRSDSVDRKRAREHYQKQYKSYLAKCKNSLK